MHLLVIASHTLAVPSFEADAIRVDTDWPNAGSQLIDVIHFACPLRMATHSTFEAILHMQMLLSIPPDAKSLPSGDHLTDRTQFLCSK